jgi:hypothetical protein
MIMKIITNFMKQNRVDQQLLITTVLTMIIIRVKLYLIPFNHIQRSIEKNTTKKASNNIPVHKLTWTVQTVSNYVPQATCLTKALTAQKLLKKYGYSSQIKIGVGKDINGEFEAHAWVEYDGKVVIGESVKEYVPLTDL